VVTSSKTQAAKPVKARTTAKTEKVERKLLRVTIDPQSLVYMKALGKHKRLKFSPTVASLIDELATNKKLMPKFTKFYTEQWPNIEPRRISNQQLFSFSTETATALERLTWDAIGIGNQSLMVRVLLAFFTDHYGLMKPGEYPSPQLLWCGA
jgi:hypothetical protein